MFMAVLAIVGVVTAVVVVLREQAGVVLRLRTLASHDADALNRGAFEQRLDAELARARRSSTDLSLVIFDVDHFKRLNDSYGHAAGDAALRAIGDIVAAGMRRSDVLRPPRRRGVRPAAARHRHRRRRDGRRQAAPPPRRPDGRPAVAHGLLRRRARSTRGTSTARAMFDDADRALYAAKRAGRDRVMRSDELPAAA